MQLNTLNRFKKYMKIKCKYSFIHLKIKFCPLVCRYSSCKSTGKIERIHKHCLKIPLNDNLSDYNILLIKSGKPAMEIKRLRVFATEVFKSINNLNPVFMKNILTSKVNAKTGPNDIIVKSRNTTTYKIPATYKSRN